MKPTKLNLMPWVDTKIKPNHSVHPSRVLFSILQLFDDFDVSKIITEATISHECFLLQLFIFCVVKKQNYFRILSHVFILFFIVTWEIYGLDLKYRCFKQKFKWLKEEEDEVY